MDHETTLERFDETEMRAWFKQNGPGCLAKTVRFDRDRFFSQPAPRRLSRRWLEWGSAAVLIMGFWGGAHFLNFSSHDASASAGGSAQQFGSEQNPHMHSTAVSAPNPTTGGAANAPAFGPMRSDLTTTVYKNPQFHFSLVVPTFLVRFGVLSQSGATWFSLHPLAEVRAYGQTNRQKTTVSSWIAQLGPETLLQQGTNWVLSSRVHVVNGVKTITEEKIFLGSQAEDVVKIQYPLRDQSQDRGWAQVILQSFTPGPL